jgi:hypothetical protein
VSITFFKILSIIIRYKKGGKLLNEEGEEEQRPLLRRAREFRKALGTHCGVPSISIFGYGIKTVTRVKVKRGPQGR